MANLLSSTGQHNFLLPVTHRRPIIGEAANIYMQSFHVKVTGKVNNNKI